MTGTPLVFSNVRKTMLDSINKQQTASRISGNEKESWQRPCEEGAIIDSEKEWSSNCQGDSKKNETGERLRGQGERCKFNLIHR